MNFSQKNLIMFHGNSSVHGRPNSVESVAEALKYPVGIIELDIRKSRDGILYCYHWSWFAWILKYLNFGLIKKTIGVNTLEEVLEVITWKKIIFLDIKDKRITAEDLKKVCDKFDQEYWLASCDLEYLGQLKSVLKSYKFVYNFGFLFFRQGVQKAKAQGINIVKVFRWQLNSNLKSFLFQSGIRFNIHPWFMNTKQYLGMVEKYGTVWIAYDDLEKLDKPYTKF